MQYPVDQNSQGCWGQLGRSCRWSPKAPGEGGREGQVAQTRLRQHDRQVGTWEGRKGEDLSFILVLVAVFNWVNSTSLCCEMKYSFLKPESNNFLQVWLIFTAELPFGTSFPYLPFPDTCGRKHTHAQLFFHPKAGLLWLSLNQGHL